MRGVGRTKEISKVAIPERKAKAQPKKQLEHPDAPRANVIALPLGAQFVMPDLAAYGISPRVAAVGIAALRDLFAKVGLPRVYVNRNADDVVRALKTNELGTIHTIVEDRPDLTAEQRDFFKAAADQRENIEKRRGTFGDGDAAGHTVYGSVHLGDRAGSERFLEDIVEGFRKNKPRETKEAQGFYLAGGAVTLVMKPAANAKTTFLGSDSFSENNWKPGDLGKLPEVFMCALARIARNNGEEAILRSILRRPADERRELLRRVLGSDLFQIDYVEAQLRRPKADDIESIILKRDVVDWPAGYLADPRAGTHAEAIAALRALAKQRGIPIRGE